jgi:hypothetical protein
MKTPPRLTPCFVSISNHQRPMQTTTVKQTSKEGVARWLSLGWFVVAPFWSEWQSQTCPKSHPSAVRKCVSQGTSPGTSRDKIQHYRSIVDRYKISEREGVDNCFNTKLHNLYESTHLVSRRRWSLSHCNAQRTPLELTCTPMPVTEEQKTRNMKRIMQKAQ